MKERQVILVTGSSTGIGAALVRGLAREGHQVAINYAHSDSAADALLGELVREHGALVMKVKADVSCRSEVRDMFAQIASTLGRVDTLINNAGINIDRPFVDMKDHEWQDVLATVLTGTFICSQEFVHQFRGDTGNIVNMGAPTALRGRKNGANYCSAKAGVIALTKCLARELAPRIRVNCVIPDFIDTEEVRTRFRLDDRTAYAEALSSIPMGRLGSPQDVLSLVRYLLSGASYTTGHNFFVDGGRFM